MAKIPSGEPISDRALNRATLERQLLLRRTKLSVMDVLQHLVGLQAQAPNPPYIGLWARIAGFGVDDLTRLLESRAAVRSTLHRATLHVLDADDFVAYRMLVQPIFERGLRGSWGKSLEGANIAELEAAGRAFLDSDDFRSAFELRHHLTERYPGFDPLALTAVSRYLLPLIHVPPGGTWEYYKPVTFAMPKRWLGRDLEPAGEPDELIRRYLRAFGPATAQDFTKWSGFTGVTEAFKRLRPEFLVLRSENGAEIFDLPDAPRPGESVESPVRLLPEWDNVHLAYAPKTARILPEAYRGRIFTNNGLIRATVLVDGYVVGAWKLERSASSASVVVELFEEVDSEARAGIEAEVASLFRTFARGRTTDLQFRPFIGIDSASSSTSAD